MINSALQGLKESDRTSNQSQQNVDLNSLSTFVERYEEQNPIEKLFFLLFKFRQKNEEKYASQKFVKDSLNRPVPGLQAIDEEQQTDISYNDALDSSRNNSDISQLNATTYKRAYQNHNQRSQTSFERTAHNPKHDSSNGNEETDDNQEEQIDTIQLEDDRQRPQSASITKPSKKSSSSNGRPPSSRKQKHRVETMQFTDDDQNVVQNFNITNDNEDEQQQQQKEISSASNQTKPLSTQDGTNSDNKSRKIRRLQHKLSMQEEETKKKFEELQSKQSRLENALKLLMKQTATYNKRRDQTNDPVEGRSN